MQYPPLCYIYRDFVALSYYVSLKKGANNMYANLVNRLLFLFSGCSFIVLIAACGSASSSYAASLKPTATPTHKPAITATATSRVPLTLTFSCGGAKGDGVQANDAHAKVCVHTLPAATLAIKVSFCKGRLDPSHELQGSFLADAHGFYQWQWTPQPDCKGQPIWAWDVSVTAKLDQQTLTITDSAMA